MATSRKPSREQRIPDSAAPLTNLDDDVRQPGATTDQGTIVDTEAGSKKGSKSDAQVTAQSESDTPVAGTGTSSSGHDRVSLMGRADDYGQGLADAAAAALHEKGADAVTSADVDPGASRRIDGIEGESTDDKHKGEIDLEFGAGGNPEPEAMQETAVARHDEWPDALAGGYLAARASRRIEIEPEAADEQREQQALERLTDSQEPISRHEGGEAMEAEAPADDTPDDLDVED